MKVHLRKSLRKPLSFLLFKNTGSQESELENVGPKSPENLHVTVLHSQKL